MGCLLTVPLINNEDLSESRSCSVLFAIKSSYLKYGDMNVTLNGIGVDCLWSDESLDEAIIDSL